MVATKIFKKCSPHGRLYLYLGQREFISADGVIEDIKGVAYVSEQSELQGKYSNASQTRGSKLAKFSNLRFLLLFFTSKLAVPLLSTQIRDFCYFLSPKNCEFRGITVLRDSIILKATVA